MKTIFLPYGLSISGNVKRESNHLSRFAFYQIENLMGFIKFLSLLIVTFLFSINITSAQDVKWSRPNWGGGYKIGLTDGATGDYFNNLQLIEFQRNFNVGKPITLFVVGGFVHANSKVASNLSSVSLGGGVALYPIYFTKLISGREYEPQEDNFHVDFGFQALLNKADFDYLYTMDVNLYSFRFKKGQKLSAKIGYNLLLSDDEVNKNQAYRNLKYNTAGFFSAGIHYAF